MKYSYHRSDIEVLEKTERSKWKVQCALFISENAILSSLLSYCFGLCRAIIICITLQYERGGKWSTKPSVQTNQDSLSERRGDQCGEQRPITSLVLPPIWKIDCIHIHPIRKKTEVLSSLHFPHILLIPFEHYGKLFGRIMKGKWSQSQDYATTESLLYATN